MFLLGLTRICLKLHQACNAQLEYRSCLSIVRQKQRRFAPERDKAINDEVDRLLKIGAIEECFYPVWLCNQL